MPPLYQDQQITSYLSQVKTGIEFYREGILPASNLNNYYDIIFDCNCGILNRVAPKAAIELTKVNSNFYASASFPVINIDNTFVKALIEIMYGTAEGMVRGLLQALITRHGHAYDNLRAIEVEKYTKVLREDYKYIVFGYGRVGFGLVQYLIEKLKVPKNHIMVIEKSIVNYEIAGLSNIQAFLSAESALPAIKNLLREKAIVITATGRQSAISQLFTKDDFSSESILLNLGTDDEWGKNFSCMDILNNKRPINFSVDPPTQLMYFEIIIEATVRAALSLLGKPDLFNPGINLFDQELDLVLLKKWMSCYPGYASIADKALNAFIKKVNTDSRLEMS